MAALFNMTEHINIRPAKIQESNLLNKLAFRSKSYWGYSYEFMEACRTELFLSESDISNSNFHCFVAEFNGKIVGYYALEPFSVDEFELEALFVEPRYIGQGIGRMLIEHAKSYARRSGVKSIIIQGDPNATQFYLAAGGIHIGERESGSIPGRYLPIFRILLQPEKKPRFGY